MNETVPTISKWISSRRRKGSVENHVEPSSAIAIQIVAMNHRTRVQTLTSFRISSAPLHALIAVTGL